MKPKDYANLCVESTILPKRNVGSNNKKGYNMKRFLCIIICVLAGTAFASIDQIASVKLQESSPAAFSFRILTIYYNKVQPPTDEALKYLHTTLEHYIRLYPDKDIMARSVFSLLGNERDEKPIQNPDGSSYIYYDATSKRITTENQRAEVETKITTKPGKNYAVKYEEKIYPRGRQGTLSVVFHSVPQENEIYRALVQELQKAVTGQNKKIETTAYAFTGNLNDSTNMKQIMGSEGVYIRVEWNPSDGKIIHKNLKNGHVREFGQITE
ncbi:MAG: hypothetical protein L6437_10580 [Kiritimatiellae bacterium]|nr:hypothetical protein [Kiritimatiellia bacterium]